jgi:hypothetical protein
VGCRYKARFHPAQLGHEFYGVDPDSAFLTSVVVHQNHARTEKAVVPSAWSANFRRDLLIDLGKIELIS